MNRTLIIVAVALALSTPAAASWISHGEQEPDTIFDIQEGRMFTDVPTDPTEKRVYFNAFQNWYTTGVNPNSGTVGSRILAPALLHFNAVVGVWTDCNGDGYVGLAETAAISYRAELLTANNCPAQPGAAFTHNDGQWVHEFLHVAPWLNAENGNNSRAPNIIPNNDTRVWGDLGVPGHVRGTSCPLAPLPHGTSASTGAAIRWADCIANFRITDTVALLAPLDGTAGQQFTFEDRNNPQKSKSVLNQDLPESVFGNPYYGENNDEKETGTLQKDLYEGQEDEYVLTVFDCDGDRFLDVHDDGVRAAGTGSEGDSKRNDNTVKDAFFEVGTSQVIVRDPTAGTLKDVFGEDNAIYSNLTDDEGSYVWAAAVTPVVGQPTWSVAASVNHTASGNSVTGGCDDTNTYNGAHNLAFFYPDGDHEGTAQASGKGQSDMRFDFFDGAEANSRVREQFGEGTPRHLGLTAGNWWTRAGWDANVIWVTDPQVVSPDTAQPSTRAYWTFYASLRSQTGGDDNVTTYNLGLPKDAVDIYGNKNCGSIGDGQPDQNGWICDPAEWYVDPTGKDVDPNKVNPRVGWTYDLMDVDCHDGELVRGSGVRASLIGTDTMGFTPENPPCQAA